MPWEVRLEEGSSRDEMTFEKSLEGWAGWSAVWVGLERLSRLKEQRLGSLSGHLHGSHLPPDEELFRAGPARTRHKGLVSGVG